MKPFLYQFRLLPLHDRISRFTHSLSSPWLPLMIVSGCLTLAGCPPDNGPLLEENTRLKKQLAKQEAVIASLQEGNKVMQQQIDLLNQEARNTKTTLEEQLQKAQEKIRALSQDEDTNGNKLRELEAANRKLAQDAKWLRTVRENMRKGLYANLEGGQIAALGHPFPAVLHAAESALSRHGYSVLATMRTDQKAVFVTERKTSAPASLELSGFRNQYLLALEKTAPKKTAIRVKADFEKLGQNGQILEAGAKEVKEIELRLIQEIHMALGNGKHS